MGQSAKKAQQKESDECIVRKKLVECTALAPFVPVESVGALCDRFAFLGEDHDYEQLYTDMLRASLRPSGSATHGSTRPVDPV
jgi:hypothetical protein